MTIQNTPEIHNKSVFNPVKVIPTILHVLLKRHHCRYRWQTIMLSRMIRSALSVRVVIQRMNWNAYPLMLHPLLISAYPAVIRHLKVDNSKRLLLLLRHSSVDSNGCWPRVPYYIYSQAEQLTQITPECVRLGWIKLSNWLPHGSIFKSFICFSWSWKLEMEADSGYGYTILVSHHWDASHEL